MGLADTVKGRMPKKPRVRPEILLCPNIPKPMSGVAPRVVLGQTWWNRTRDAAASLTYQHCAACGVYRSEAQFRQWLEGHEMYDIDYQRGRMVYTETVSICHACHNFVHDGRMRALVAKGDMAEAKYVTIMQHGQRVLEEANLCKPTPEELEEEQLDYLLTNATAPWGTWRMVVEGKEYPPKFKNAEAWRLAFR